MGDILFMFICLGIIVGVALFLIIKGICSLYKGAYDTTHKQTPAVTPTSVIKTAPVPTPTPIDSKEEERKKLESYRSICHKIIDGFYTTKVVADISSYELGDGRGSQCKRVKWFNARGIALQFGYSIDATIYFAFLTHDEIDSYFDRYISADEQERKSIDDDYLTEMNNWEQEQIKLYQAEQDRKEREAIATRIKEKQRRRQLEKEVRQQLIDSGELFGDKTKRPPIPKEVADAVWRRDGGRCVYCGSTENLQYDHIIPFSKGGATSLENLQLLCQKCNLEKSNHIG